MTSELVPTTRLRFVERVPGWVPLGAPFQMQHVLQQWWENADSSAHPTPGEWRDVPVEEECA